MAQERLDKLLSSTGRWSRREVKDLVKAGRVTADGRPLANNARITGGEVLTVTLPDPEPLFRPSMGRPSQSSCRFPTRVSTVALRYMQRVFSLIASAHSGVVTVPPPSEMMTVS